MGAVIIAGNPLGTSIATGELEDGAVTNAKVNTSAAIAYSKLAALTSGNILVGNGSNVAVSVTPTGDVTINNAGVTAIASGVVVNDDVNASAAIAFSKLAALTSGNILVGNGSNVAVSVAMSGDVTLSNAGVATLSNAAKTNRYTIQVVEFDDTTQVVTGTGATSVEDYSCALRTGVTNPSTAKRAINWGNSCGSGAGNTTTMSGDLDFSKDFIIGFRIAVTTAAANGQCWVRIGQNNAGDVSSWGIGIAIDNLTLNGEHMDNVTRQETSLATTMTADVTYNIRIEKIGTQIEWFVNNVSKATSSTNVPNAAAGSGLNIVVANKNTGADYSVAVGDLWVMST